MGLSSESQRDPIFVELGGLGCRDSFSRLSHRGLNPIGLNRNAALNSRSRTISFRQQATVDDALIAVVHRSDGRA